MKPRAGTIEYRTYCPTCKTHQVIRRTYGEAYVNEDGHQCQKDSESCTVCGSTNEGEINYGALAGYFRG